MSLLMAAEGTVLSTAYENLVYELEQRSAQLRSLADVEIGHGSSSCVGVVLINDLDMHFQSASWPFR